MNSDGVSSEARPSFHPLIFFVHSAGSGGRMEGCPVKEELMVLGCGAGEDSRESLGLQGDPTSPS